MLKMTTRAKALAKRVPSDQSSLGGLLINRTWRTVNQIQIPARTDTMTRYEDRALNLRWRDLLSR